ncbi:MAG: gephyrin-like molybdotransferase Glp [Trueperaceae bacterium]
MAGAVGIPVSDALERVRAAMGCLPSVELPLEDAHGRVLTNDLLARADHPTADDSALDGVACRLADTVGATKDQPVRLRWIGEVPAGRPFDGTVGPGEAVSIYTGALMPHGADGVVPVERLHRDGDTVWVQQPASLRDVRPRGQALRAGALALATGTRLDAAHLALAASAGHGRVEVARAPRVVVVATGDELLSAGATEIGPGRSFESNGPGLVALAREAHAAVVRSERVGDDPDALRRCLDRAAGDADLVVTSGGVSMGARDHVRTLLEREGEVAFWRVAMKPGGPTLFGRWRGTPVLGLPGNPVASLLVFWLLGLPALRALEGERAPSPLAATWPAQAGHGLQGATGRVHFARVRLRREGASWIADPVSTQSSGVLRSLTEADALAVLPPNSSPQAGDTIEVLPWRTAPHA